MSSDKDRDSSSSGPEIATPTTSGPPSPQLSASQQYPTSPPSGESHHHILILISLIYPATIVLGSLFSIISPIGQSASYFSRKNNIFNVLFVKIGWFWTTVAFLVHITNLRHPNVTHARSKALIRWGLATLAWILVTQWFFGPPLMDRTFTVTGGSCRPNYDTQPFTLASKSEQAFTSAACKGTGGKWDGGHDLSGHAFMLTHASLFLWAEALPRLVDSMWRGTVGPRNLTPLMAEWFGVHWFVWGILGLWWWMLLMTSVYFHTWSEKVSGWFVALFEWGILYAYMIPLNPQARRLFGTPTV
ncbi:hypothetical protein TWF106_004780 [Orbilia oligospora]|uniref:Acyl-coenzyme A diphosphatase SCS3 n=1 Tax=Orbilia oligospora TaxID=2813651 RepID=A0A6G1LSH0_ORBOL|nr:hypothetical protein TWF788_001586 [Orbilia oligospora]KAF3196697.1 hypothetical protein TWF679_004535 [Orbilia oligospora]KAF3198128.1 hypothetical protein TWF106_004780 [Orbilia oligospora]KAF3215733.1 hypothetical protein TWF191_009218 [Orbilia oligospora]KAF3232640.1 hypothetical protein TWF192_003068 [Orbilia oligospora]